MTFVLVVILLLVVLFSILPEILPGISRKLVDLTVEESEDEKVKRKEVSELKSELRNVSMVDEFAKHARIERKLIKMKEELNKLSKSKTEVFLKFKLGINTVFHVIQMVCFLFIIYNYRYSPLIYLSPDWFTPLNRMISFPTGLPGAVSVTFWIVTCRTTVPRVMRLFS